MPPTLDDLARAWDRTEHAETGVVDFSSMGEVVAVARPTQYLPVPEYTFTFPHLTAVECAGVKSLLKTAGMLTPLEWTAPGDLAASSWQLVAFSYRNPTMAQYAVTMTLRKWVGL